MKRFCLALLTGSTLVLTSLTSCAQQGSSTESSVAYDAATEMASEVAPVAPQAGRVRVAQKVSEESDLPTQSTAVISAERPQLIKRATIFLDVTSIEEGLAQVREIVQVHQGDVLSMDDMGDRTRRINFTLRVPQSKLDVTLDALIQLGTVRSRSIYTEDVSSQLVDIQARLKNARKSEAALQEIMSRSGKVSEVLEVARELSNVRQGIEQMAAQQKNLQTQVQYSTINLTLQSAITLSPNKPAFSSQLANSWESATFSVREFTTDLLQLGLWLLAYSPYLAVVLCGAVIARRVRRARMQ